MYIQFFTLYWPDVGPNLGRNRSPLKKHIRKSLLVMTGEFLDLNYSIFLSQ